MTMETIRIYIHIPFCPSRCQYCDFNTFSGKDYLFDSYFTALDTEISLLEGDIAGKTITSVFFGGGTPTHVPPRFLRGILSRFQIPSDAEVTVEANPGTVNLDMMREYRNMGINRISFGVQSFHNNLLHLMGRIHDRTVAITNIEEAKRAGFQNISADLIIGYPKQTFEMHRETLDILLELRPTHVSCYSLHAGEKTPLESMLRKRILPEPSEEEDRRMYHLTVEKLEREGIHRYEISNFARSGYQSSHNSGYWKMDEYLGLGAGAHSYINHERFSNKCLPGNYIMDLKRLRRPVAERQKITREESMREFMVLGLRMAEGIDPECFFKAYGKSLDEVYLNEIAEGVNEGLLIREDRSVRLTNLGFDWANRVFSKF